MKKFFLVLLLGFSSLFAFEDLTNENFDQKISNKNVIIEFYASWWYACKVLGKNLTKYETSNPNDGVTIYKVDIEVQSELAMRLKASVMPALAYIENGLVLALERGVKTPDEIKANVEEYFH